MKVGTSGRVGGEVLGLKGVAGGVGKIGIWKVGAVGVHWLGRQEGGATAAETGTD